MELLATILILILTQVNIELCTGIIQCFTDTEANSTAIGGTDCSTDEENCLSEVKYTGAGFKEKSFAHRCQECEPTADVVGRYDNLTNTWTSSRCCGDNDCNDHDLSNETLFPPGFTCFKCASNTTECRDGGGEEAADYKKDTAVCDFNNHQCSSKVTWKDKEYIVERGCTTNCTEYDGKEKTEEGKYKYSKCCNNDHSCNLHNLTVTYNEAVKLQDTDEGPTCFKCASKSIKCRDGGGEEAADYKKDTAVCDFNTHQCSTEVTWNDDKEYIIERGCTKNCTEYDGKEKNKEGKYKYSECCNNNHSCNMLNLTETYNEAMKLYGNAVTNLVSTYTLLGLLSICYYYLR